jgi:hypothetical protein
MSTPIKVTHVTSLDLTAFVPFRTLRRYEEHKREGVVVIEGEQAVRRLLRSPHHVVCIGWSDTSRERWSRHP